MKYLFTVRQALSPSFFDVCRHSWMCYISLEAKTKHLKQRYDQWTTMYLLTVCPPSLPFNSSNHPSRHLHFSAVVCLFILSVFPPATVKIFILCPLQE